MDFSTKYCDLNVSQYGSKPGQLCHSTILNKVYTYYILRVTKKNRAYVELDVVVNYDRMIMALVVLACSRLGLGESLGKFCLMTWNT